MSTDSFPDPEYGEEAIAEWIPNWNTRWHVLLGGLLVGIAILTHGAATERLEDAGTGVALLGMAAWGWYLQRDRRFSTVLPRVGGVLGLWLVTVTLVVSPHRSLLMVGSLTIGGVLIVTDALFYHLLKTL